MYKNDFKKENVYKRNAMTKWIQIKSTMNISKQQKSLEYQEPPLQDGEMLIKSSSTKQEKKEQDTEEDTVLTTTLESSEEKIILHKRKEEESVANNWSRLRYCL